LEVADMQELEASESRKPFVYLGITNVDVAVCRKAVSNFEQMMFPADEVGVNAMTQPQRPLAGARPVRGDADDAATLYELAGDVGRDRPRRVTELHCAVDVEADHDPWGTIVAGHSTKPRRAAFVKH
jgi:hypothetical protein